MAISEKVKGFTKRLEVPHNSKEPFSLLFNKDVAPMPTSRRDLGFWAYNGIWSIPNLTIWSFSTGSAILVLGLNIGYGMGALTIGNILISIYTCLNSSPGYWYHIGYSVCQRMIFGIYGSGIGIAIRILLSIVFYGSQSWLGGLCIVVMLSSWSKTFMDWQEMFTGQTLMRDFIGFLIFQIIQFPFFLVKPERIHRWINFACVITLAAMLAVFINTLVKNGGPGPLYYERESLDAPNLGWQFLNAATVWYGALSPDCTNVSDYTRFAGNKWHMYLGVVSGVCLSGTLVPLMGLLTASASVQLYNVEYWLPTDICLQWMSDNYTPGVRAAAFFCGFAFMSSQLTFNVATNGITFGMDVSALFAKYLDIKRGAVICALLSWVVQPWNFYNSSSVFLTVMSSFGVIVTPIIAIIVADFHIVRRHRIKLSDLYTADAEGCFYFFYGVNWRAALVWAAGVAPGIPGLVNAVQVVPNMPNGLNNFYYGNILFAFFCPLVLYVIVCRIFPLPRLGEMDDEDIYNVFTLEECQSLGIAPASEVFESDGRDDTVEEETHPKTIDA